MLTVHFLSGGDVTKYELIYEQPWTYVFHARGINLVMSEFQERLREIMKNKK